MDLLSSWCCFYIFHHYHHYVIWVHRFFLLCHHFLLFSASRIHISLPDCFKSSVDRNWRRPLKLLPIYGLYLNIVLDHMNHFLLVTAFAVSLIFTFAGSMYVALGPLNSFQFIHNLFYNDSCLEQNRLNKRSFTKEHVTCYLTRQI